MEAQSTVIDMQLSNFHPFMRLPCELRLQIWGLAVRPSGGKRGVHYLNLARKDAVLDGTAGKLTPFGKTERLIFKDHIAVISKLGTFGDESHKAIGCQSVYLWDAGLWTACTESRNVITEQLKTYKWLEEIRSLEKKYEIYYPCISENDVRISERHQEMTAMFTVHQEESMDWRLMFHPFYDLFCFTSQDWSTKIHLRRVLDSMPICLGGYSNVNHVAVEFDSSWKLNWPESIHDLLDECSARGLVARIVQEFAEGNWTGTLWLIDRHAQKTRSEGGLLGGTLMEFFDTNEEYIETDPSCLKSDPEDENSWTAADFIHELDELGLEFYTVLWLEPSLSDDGTMWFHAEDSVKILTCKERGR